MEGQGFRDRSPSFEQAGAAVVGASFDPPGDNLTFAVDQELPFPLLSDLDGSVADAYGVRRAPTSRWRDMPERRTFLIDPSGVVQRIYDVTDVFHHPQQVLDDLLALQGSAT